jgi:hypothetical protein
MKGLFASAAVASLALSDLALLARGEDQPVPATSNVPGALTQSIHRDRRITLTLKAPDAGGVAVAVGDGQGIGPFPMTNDADGTWSVTTSPSVPGFHYYWFVASGVSVNDPATERYFGCGQETSGMGVPEAGADFYAITNVPYGEGV